jgi:hypothetical protein
MALLELRPSCHRHRGSTRITPKVKISIEIAVEFRCECDWVQAQVCVGVDRCEWV